VKGARGLIFSALLRNSHSLEIQTTERRFGDDIPNPEIHSKGEEEREGQKPDVQRE